MRRLDRLPTAVIAGVALDLAGMLVLATSGHAVWRWIVLAPALVALGAWCVARGARSMGADLLARRMRYVAIATAVSATCGALELVSGGDAGNLAALPMIVAGLLHAVVWVLAVPFAHRPNLRELGAGIVYLGLGAYAMLLAPVARQSDCACHVADPTPEVAAITGAFLFALYWLAPRADVADPGRGLARVAAAASWGAFGLLATPFLFEDGRPSVLFTAWLLVAAAASLWLAAATWRHDLRALALGAAGLAVLLLASLGSPSVPEPAIMATATLGWIAVATRAGTRRVIDPVAIAAGVALTVATCLLPSPGAPGLRGPAGLALALGPALLRSIYLAALALRAIRGADALTRTRVPQAVVVHSPRA